MPPFKFNPVEFWAMIESERLIVEPALAVNAVVQKETNASSILMMELLPLVRMPVAL